MSLDFQILDYRETPMGTLILRRRRILMLGNTEVFEIKLGDAFLMSSLFHEVEEALAHLAIKKLDGPIDVVIGGLGLGYTAAAALEHDNVRSLLVVDALEDVIRWHRKGIVPLGKSLEENPRCKFIRGDFFEMASSRSEGFDPDNSDRKFHAVLLDIDHSPKNLLHEQHAAFYTEEGLRALCKHICPGGIFAMWSDETPDTDFLKLLASVFENPTAKEVAFENPIRGDLSRSTIYIAEAKS